MAPLPRELRKTLKDAVVAARRLAESAARAALTTLAVDDDRPHPQMGEDKRRLRVALRARARQLGGTNPLVAEIAYQHWHRMLFARFLAENRLLMHPSGVPVTLEEVAELARDKGEADPWALAARYATGMLPAVFRTDDPVLAVSFAPEGRQALEHVLDSLPAGVFRADDALGWVYQFWQSERKKEVNRSGRKIGAEELPAVTQLFTEDYMVRFLLENSLGAWWAAHRPDSPLVKEFTYLRSKDDGTPAAGGFDGWPERAAEVTVMDPSCGSGHFLTAAFVMLAQMRMEEEGLSKTEAGDVVIRDNLFGLEIDPRCTQIAAFALALAAWKSGGYRALPSPNLACSGIGVKGQLAEWRKLARCDERLEQALDALHEQFRNAPDLGSLIDPRRATDQGHLFAIDYEEVAPLLEELLAREEDPETRVAGWAAEGIARAAALLTRTYTLVTTNVPYLTRGKQGDALKEFCERHYPEARQNLATCFTERCWALVEVGGSYALVTPQNWLLLTKYSQLRRRLLEKQTWLMVAKLGERAFEEVTGAVVNAALVLISNAMPIDGSSLASLDVAFLPNALEKENALQAQPLAVVEQASQLRNPDSRISLQAIDSERLLSYYARGVHGLGTKDAPRFVRCVWEVPDTGADWEFMQSTVETTRPWGGMEHIVYWQQGNGILHELARRGAAILAGGLAHGRPGVLVSQMGNLPCTLYHGGLFDKNAAVISPYDAAHAAAIWAFCSSSEYAKAVRMLDTKMNVTNTTLVKVPFDFKRWQKVAEKAEPLPERYSNDPTQWLFKGDPPDSTEPLQVAVARLLGYRWPDQEPDALDELADRDGIACLPAVAGEQPAAERLRALLERVYSEQWSQDLLNDLLAKAGAPGESLEKWLRDSFFAGHCRLFHNRPFLWHVWDGRKDGFSALVNYHRLDNRLLSRLTHTLVGSWIRLQWEQAKAEVPGAEARLVAAEKLKRKLELILEGEPPYDIYVRWKSLELQPVGWNPDLNDGVRLNIRPFVKADILRSRFTVNWNKDRGKDPDGSERVNDLHLTRAEKEAARARAGRI